MRRSFLRTALFASVLAAAAPARAGDEGRSRVLFDQGLADLEAGRFEQACPAIEQSYQLDPRPGTLFTLAECESQRGRLATAVTHYTDYLAVYKGLDAPRRTEHKERADVAAAEIASLRP